MTEQEETPPEHREASDLREFERGKRGAEVDGPRYPLLYQINTRVWMTELSRALGRPATLDDIPGPDLDRITEMGFDWVWLLSVWETGPAGQLISRNNAEWRKEFEATLPDLSDEDIEGSGFAVTGYAVHPRLGGDAALARLRKRLQARGIRLMLDFVPNHTGLDHPWVENHPEYYVQGTEETLAREPANYVRVKGSGGDKVFAHGRDPYFPGWPDTVQLDYSNEAFQEAMIGELLAIAEQCDGVRCDMAMLVLPDVFERTWGVRPKPFWPAAMKRVRDQVQGFRFMAEVYWDLEWTMIEQGFDYAYDKRLYDRLRGRDARLVREHLQAGLDYQGKLARFLENHDEPRAATVFPPGMHEAAAVITYLSPGLRLFHVGQFEGRKKRISPHLVRAPQEPVDSSLEEFYTRLMAVVREPALKEGNWTLLDCEPAWEGNWTSDCFIAYFWQGPGDRCLLVTVNYSDHQSQCYVRLPFAELGGAQWRLHDILDGAWHDRDGDNLQSRGLYLDVPAWHYHGFTLEKLW
jgi:glycosidase